MNNPIEISVVAPLYNTKETISTLVSQLESVFAQLGVSFEIILVDDASPQNDWLVVEDLCKRFSFVKGIKLSRNFGQHIAITAGLQYSSGKWVVVMDADLQDTPTEIISLYKTAQSGYDLAYAQRKVRQDSWYKRQTSKWFYKIFGFLTNTKQDASIGNFGIYNQKVIQAILSMKDATRYFPTMAQWVGFKSTSIEVQHAARQTGKSSYNLYKLFHLAFDNIIAFSDKPLRLTIKLGFLISLISFIIGTYYFISYSLGQIKVTGFTSLILSIWFLSGIIISLLGIIGIYIAKIFDKVKDRPIFIVESKINI